MEIRFRPVTDEDRKGLADLLQQRGEEVQQYLAAIFARPVVVSTVVQSLRRRLGFLNSNVLVILTPANSVEAVADKLLEEPAIASRMSPPDAREATDKPLYIDHICRVAGVSQRTLRNAFQAIYGSTPYRHLRTIRMGEARKALLSPVSPIQTVTEVAMHFGFLELGRFSVEYRRAFGERPSATLRRERRITDTAV